jgi:chromosome segregation ATPase
VQAVRLARKEGLAAVADARAEGRSALAEAEERWERVMETLRDVKAGARNEAQVLSRGALLLEAAVATLEREAEGLADGVADALREAAEASCDLALRESESVGIRDELQECRRHVVSLEAALKERRGAAESAGGEVERIRREWDADVQRLRAESDAKEAALKKALEEGVAAVSAR